MTMNPKNRSSNPACEFETVVETFALIFSPSRACATWANGPFVIVKRERNRLLKNKGPRVGRKPHFVLQSTGQYDDEYMQFPAHNIFKATTQLQIIYVFLRPT